MPDGTGLNEFAKLYPNRFFDVGIAEEHATTLSAGMASAGLRPIFAVYSTFLQRAFDQIIHDVCIQNLPVIFAVDRAGIVGADGETHQGILDLSFFKVIPNITIMAPKDFKELEDMMNFAIILKKPVVIRYPRGGEAKEKFITHSQIQYKRSDILTIGNDVTIVAIGNQVAKALNVCRKLKEAGINAEVINARFLKPFDKYTVLKSINKTHFVVTIEDNSLVGGLGAEVKELIAERRIPNVIVRNFGYPDVFVEHGTPQELEEIYKLDEKSVFNYITNEIKYKKRTNKNNKFNKKNKTKKYVDNKANKNIDESQNKIG